MKISELNQKSFLGAAGAAQNSYVLINYEDNTTNEPVTYRASLDELGKAIANNLHLYKKTSNGAVTTSVSQGAYVNNDAEQFITMGHCGAINMLYGGDTRVTADMIGAASTGDVTNATSGLASTGYVDNALESYLTFQLFSSYMSQGGYIDGQDLNIAIDGLASTGYVDAAAENVSRDIRIGVGGESFRYTPLYWEVNNGGIYKIDDRNTNSPDPSIITIDGGNGNNGGSGGGDASLDLSAGYALEDGAGSSVNGYVVFADGFNFYTATASEGAADLLFKIGGSCNSVMLYDNNTQKLEYYTNADSQPTVIGYPLVFNDTNNEIGYYTYDAQQDAQVWNAVNLS